MNAALILLGCAVVRSSPASSPAASEVRVDAIVGTWTYAEDPTGRIPTDPVYVGSVMMFGADGAYAFQLGESALILEGTWALLGTEGAALRVHADYGRGRQHDLTLVPRRGPDGGVQGLEVRQADGSARYHARTETSDG